MLLMPELFREGQVEIFSREVTTLKSRNSEFLL